jgi:hypothetical protein
LWKPIEQQPALELRFPQSPDFFLPLHVLFICSLFFVRPVQRWGRDLHAAPGTVDGTTYIKVVWAGRHRGLSPRILTYKYLTAKKKSSNSVVSNAAR